VTENDAEARWSRCARRGADLNNHCLARVEHGARAELKLMHANDMGQAALPRYAL